MLLLPPVSLPRFVLRTLNVRGARIESVRDQQRGDDARSHHETRGAPPDDQVPVLLCQPLLRPRNGGVGVRAERAEPGEGLRGGLRRGVQGLGHGELLRYGVRHAGAALVGARADTGQREGEESRALSLDPLHQRNLVREVVSLLAETNYAQVHGLQERGVRVPSRAVVSRAGLHLPHDEGFLRGGGVPLASGHSEHARLLVGLRQHRLVPPELVRGGEDDAAEDAPGQGRFVVPRATGDALWPSRPADLLLPPPGNSQKSREVLLAPAEVQGVHERRGGAPQRHKIPQRQETVQR
mmetsp:Transcript_9102/g.31340  ORF Transcript_9102/g.31340 Transcript_9102/m.31340 type:complete len:296 (+) Transcript_9102:7233-8120(+)